VHICRLPEPTYQGTIRFIAHRLLACLLFKVHGFEVGTRNGTAGADQCTASAGSIGSRQCPRLASGFWVQHAVDLLPESCLLHLLPFIPCYSPEMTEESWLQWAKKRNRVILHTLICINMSTIPSPLRTPSPWIIYTRHCFLVPFLQNRFCRSGA
jgi:hypothetical protein